MLRTAALICVTGLMFRAAAAEDWRQFRGPDGQGVSTAKGLPQTWDDSKNIRWRAALPGYGSSSPIALGERLYVTCYSGYGIDRSGTLEDLRLHLLAINASDGEVVWSQELEPTLPESQSVRDHGYAAATPATDGESIYVFFGKSGVCRFGLDGQLQWRKSVGTGLDRWGCGTSPVLFENLVIVNASVESGAVVALHKHNGEEAWRTDGIRRSWSTPHLVRTADGETELVVSLQGKVRGLNPANGEELWTCTGIQDYVCPSLVSQDGVVYVVGGRTSRTLAIRAGGRGDVTDSHRLWEARVGANVCSPVIQDGHLYGVSDRNKTAYCVRLNDGEVLYQERFPSQPYASALAADGKLYIVTRQEGTYVLAPTTEYKQLAHNRLSDRSTFNATPIVADGNLILRSDTFLYCIGEG